MVLLTSLPFEEAPVEEPGSPFSVVEALLPSLSVAEVPLVAADEASLLSDGNVGD